MASTVRKRSSSRASVFPDKLYSAQYWKKMEPISEWFYLN